MSTRLSSQWLGGLGLLCLMSLTLFLRYGSLLTASSQEIVNPSGDPFNGYNIVTYQAKFADSYTHFKGNAYPYGEHIVLASALPLLSNSLHFLKEIGLDLTAHTIPIIHWSILFSYLTAAIFLYLILIKYNLPIWYSILVAVGITFLSPQTDRVFSHFGLAHAYTIPMVIYWLLVFEEKPRWWVSIALFLTVLLTALIQFYFFAIAAAIISVFYFLCVLLKTFKQPAKSKKWLTFWQKIRAYLPHYSIQVLLPFLLFQWWLGQFDVPDRPPNPFGYTYYTTKWEGIFLSLRMPYYQWVHENWLPIKKVTSEGTAYVGLIATIVLITWGISWLTTVFKITFFEKIIIDHSKKLVLKSLLGGAFILLLFSTGFPFTIPQFEFLFDYAGPLRQFRSVGRFNWFFYYVLNLVAFIYLYHQAIYLWKNGWKYGKYLLLISIAILYFEAWTMHQTRPYRLYYLEELAEKNYYQKQFNFEPANYQAVLALPFFHVGTDHFSAKVTPFIQQKSSLLTMETGLPAIAALSNRSSIGHTFNLIQLASEVYQVPAALADFPNKKPILVMLDTNFISDYQTLLNPLKLIGQKGRLALYELPLNAYQKNILTKKQKIQLDIQQKTLYPFDDFLSSDSTKHFIYKNFDTKKSKQKYKGAGALALDISSETTILKAALPNATIGETYTLSFWSNAQIYKSATAFVYLKAYDKQTGKLLWRHFPQIRNYLTVLDNNGWALFEFPFKLEKDGIIEVSILQASMKKEVFYLDELLFKKETTELYQSADNLFYNNRWYSK